MDGETEILSFGRPRLPRPSRVPRVLVGVVVVGALVTGYLLAGRATDGAPAPGGREVTGPTLVAGTVREGPDAWERVTFEVVLHNSGPAAVVVYVDRVGPVDVRRNVTRGPVLVAAGATASIDVEAPSACDGPDTGARFTTVTADVDSGDGRVPVVIPLLDATDLLDYLDTVCRPPSTDLVVSALVGVWTLEEIGGRRADDDRPRLLWFRPDRTFVMDGRGQLFTARSQWRGSYTVRDGVLRMVTAGGTVCDPGQHTSWQVHRRTPRLVDARVLGGSCPAVSGGLWQVHRILSGAPNGVEW
jgi:hypothetical protein